MTEAELRDALQDKTLAEIAKEKGKSVSGSSPLLSPPRRSGSLPRSPTVGSPSRRRRS